MQLGTVVLICVMYILIIQDNNATHVIQKILLCIDKEKRGHLIRVILKNFRSLALDCNGICVLKKFINSNKSDKVRKDILNELVDNALEIVQSPFGNYAIQYAIQEWGISFCRNIVDVIVNNIVSLSMQKYSSNAVEKVLDLADEVY